MLMGDYGYILHFNDLTWPQYTEMKATSEGLPCFATKTERGAHCIM